MERSTIEGVRAYKFDPKNVIEGLNGYYESERTVPTKGFIRVYRDLDGPAYLGADMWLSALIEWLREDHAIFYRPGLIFDQVEAARNAAKICCLRAHIKEELSKRDLWCNKDEDIPELVEGLFRALDCCDERANENRKEAATLSKQNRELKESVCKDIMNYIRYEASRNGFNLPEEIDGEPLTVKRAFHDLLEVMRKRGEEIRIAEIETRKAVNEQLKKDTDYVADTLCGILEALGISKSDTAHLDIPGLKTKALQRANVIKSERDRYLKQRDTAVADYKALSEENQKRDTEIKNLKERIAELESNFKAVCDEDDIFRTRALKAEEDVRKLNAELKSSQKSDVNKLIRDCCTEHGIIAPSPYFSDEACIEYLCNLYLCNRDSHQVELKRARDTIETLKSLINDVNAELEEY